MSARRTVRPHRAKRPASAPAAGTRAQRLAELAPRDAWARQMGARLVAGGRGGAGSVTLRLRVTEAHTNFYGFCHGGVIFTLADSAFGLACNAAGAVTVALDAHIAFTRAVRAGEELIATARELARTRRTGSYRVEVRTGDGQRVAHFLGTAYVPGEAGATGAAAPAGPAAPAAPRPPRQGRSPRAPRTPRMPRTPRKVRSRPAAER